ncbi:MAG: biotin/acetyl-CoA-carboxylase ligase [Pseudonocardiales bacterium]|nr:biotin/acetyl-CoA-carboxylase ligase [Pseudonocardiales bacterium]
MTRDPLDAEALRAALLGSSKLVSSVDVVEETTSTNADLLVAAGTGGQSGQILVAEFQSAGRGRFDRIWTSPPRAGLTFSLLLRPEVPRARWGWLPLLTGLALRGAVLAGLPGSAVPGSIGDDVRLKWPNDLLLGPDAGKAAGILVQATADAAVVGVGVNVDHTRDELPTEQATSLHLVFGGAAPSRSALLVDFMTEFETRYAAWSEAAGDADASGLRREYLAACDTIGRAVRVERPDGDLDGRADSVDADGSLVLLTADGARTLSAGDVVHLRPAGR